MAYSLDQLKQMTIEAANRYGFNPMIALAQIYVESGFALDRVSPDNARGIAQFIPPTAARFGLSDPTDPVAALDAYGRYMRFMLDMFGGRIDLALAGYNSGENRQEYKNAAAEGRAINWSVLPYRVQTETQNYVNKIINAAPNWQDTVTRLTGAVIDTTSDAGQSVVDYSNNAASAITDFAGNPIVEDGFIGVFALGLAAIVVWKVFLK